MADWEKIVRANAAMVTHAAMRVLGSAADAEDVAQEVFIEAYRKWGADADQQWPALLRRMAVFRALDCLRQRKSHETLLAEPTDRDDGDPATIAAARELERRLRVAVAMLPDREAQVLSLVCFEGLSQSEVAETLGIQRTSVAAMLSKARGKVHQQLGYSKTGARS